MLKIYTIFVSWYNAKMQKKVINEKSLETNELIVKENSLLSGQFGVFSKKPFPKGQKLFLVKGPIKSKPSIYTLSAGLDKHVDPRKEDGSLDFGHYLNHSCDPNAVVKVVSGKNRNPYIKLLARRNIKKGEELTFDYASLEYSTVINCACKCSAKKCRGVVYGFKDLPESVVQKYKKEGMIAKHLLDLIK